MANYQAEHEAILRKRENPKSYIYVCMYDMANYQAEHEAILRKRENPKSLLTWDEYKSKTFTLQVS
jgi:hypothetical protein